MKLVDIGDIAGSRFPKHIDIRNSTVEAAGTIPQTWREHMEEDSAFRVQAVLPSMLKTRNP